MNRSPTPDRHGHAATIPHDGPTHVRRNGRHQDSILFPFDQSVQRFPHAVAIRWRDHALTYAELDAQANRLAHWLIHRKIDSDAIVGIRLKKSVEALVCILGTLKAGAAYLPLDPNYPAERLQVMVADAIPALVIGNDDVASAFPNVPTINWDDLLFQLDEQSTETPFVMANDDHLAYVLFTSGSTGRPKGVAMRRGPLRNLIAWQIKNSSVGPGDATLQFASLSFDVSFQEIFSTWATGGELVLPREADRRDATALGALIENAKIRRLFCPFVLLQQLAETLPTPPSCLREVITAGEQLTVTPAVRRFFSALPNCTLWNHYGPTESHVVTAYKLPTEPSAWPTLPPIGRPIDGAMIYLVDQQGEQVESGEIWIGGDCLAQGYIHRPELTAERFRPDPFRPGGCIYRTGDLGCWNDQGELEFLGRCDQQVKIRGFRVEPGEIEAVLTGHQSIREAVVVAREDTPGDRRLVAYIIGDRPSPSELRKYLSERLPDYMIPAAFISMDVFPKTPSGKVDRKALPAPSRERPSLATAMIAPRTQLEESIARVWSDVLQVDQVGVHDPFFDLGGNSLALARVHVKLRDQIETQISITDLFRFPTIAGLAGYLNKHATTTAAVAIQSKIKSINEPIAIIGMAGRFPKAANVDELWRNLCAGVEGISFFTDDELRAEGIPEALINNPGYVKARGVIADADRFDASFFGYQPREAELTDPQQRVFLETAWAALEDAGLIPDATIGRVGVFAGISMNTYLLNNVLQRRDAIDGFLAEFQSGGYPILVGNDKDYLATRVAFKLNLHGPAITVQTACSTSLVAIVEAVESLRAGACDVALAGGVSITFPQKRGSLYQEGAITSPDGHCRPFDAAAKGTVFGEGAAVVVLKRLDQAIADRDPIYAVVKGVGLSNDGADKVSYLAPSVDGQVEAFANAVAQAEIEPSSVGYIEAHGTGTPLGDPIEVAALAKVYRGIDDQECLLGSVKSNIGHLEAAAGATGLIKAALALHHRKIPGTLHYRQPNPALDLERTHFRITSETSDWPSDSQRRAAVTSLGVGGTNAHVILEEAPLPAAIGPAWNQQLLLLSARTAASLHDAAKNLESFLSVHPGTSLADTAFTLQVGRKSFEQRSFVVADSCANAVSALSKPPKVKGPITLSPPVLFMFPGQGAQSAGMTKSLYDAEPTYRATVDLCCELLKPHLELDLRDILFEQDERLNQTRITQPALFVVEYSLAQMLLGWGVTLAGMFGHSIGEYVAACLAGVFSLEDALMLVAKRGELIQSCPTGVMLAVRAAEAEVRKQLPEMLDIAAFNSPTQTVVSGAADAVAEFERFLNDRQIQCKRLVTSHAFHSRLLDPAVVKFQELVSTVQRHAPTIPFVSCVTGTWITREQATDPAYWAGQLRQGVRCADGLATLTEQPGVVLEIGPGQTLCNLARQVTGKNTLDAISGFNDPAEVLNSLGRLWQNGVEVDWNKFHALSQRRRISLPTYAFERQRYWISKSSVHNEPSGVVPVPERPEFRHGSSVELVSQLQTVFADLAGVAPEAIFPEATFFELGFDSLFLTQAVQAIQQRFGVKVSFRQLLESVPTTQALAEYLGQQRPAILTATAQVQVETPNAEPTPQGFGAFAPIDRSTETEWSPRQLRFLDEFISRWSAKTARSKAHVQAHRLVHADPRTVSGFTRLWKDMVYPLVIDRSAGSRLWDIDGHEYVDMLNGFGPDLLGHSPACVVQAVEQQLRAGYEVGPLSPLAGELAQLICSMTGMERASFVCTGSEAVQAALRAARTVTGRDKVVTFARDYHGNFDEVLLRPGGDPQRPNSPSAPGVPRAAVSNMIVLDYGTDEALEVIRRLGPELAAVLVEPVQSRRPEWQPREFLHKVRELTQESGACLIFDEVITGFRLHLGGAQALFGVRADLATFGKVIGGGMPIGAIAGSSKYMDAFDGGMWQFGDESFPTAGRTFFAGTFVRHPLALAAGLATLRHLQQEGPSLQERLNGYGDRLAGRLNELTRSHHVPMQIVNCGSLMFFRVLGGSKEASLLFYLLRDRGIYLLEGFPSYISAAHGPADLEQIESAFRDSILELKAHGFFASATSTVVMPELSGEWIPLTEAQRELWLSAQAGNDASRAFNETCTLRMQGSFDLAAFQRATQKLVARHEALRAVFDPGGRGQRFLSEVNIDVPVTDLSAYPADVRESRLRQLQEAEDQFIFDLAQGPLLRLHVVRLADDDHGVLMTAHHIACDGWSYDIILHDLGTLYSAEVSGHESILPPADSFREYAVKQSQRDDRRELRYWLQRLRPSLAPLDLPLDHARGPRRTFRGARITRSLGVNRSVQFKQLAASIGCTPYAALLTAFEVLLARLSNQTDMVVGIPVAGQSIAQKKSLVGHCVHFLPLRLHADLARPFAEVASAVKTTMLDAFEHQDFTFVSLLKSLPNPDPARPLVAVGFNLDPVLSNLGFAGLQVVVEKNPKHYVNLELHWNLVDTGYEYVLEAEYNSDLFDAASVTRWANQFQTLLDDAVVRPTTPIQELQMLDDAERRQMLVEWNNTTHELPNRCVHELFEEQARSRPNSPALAFDDSIVTFLELNRRSNGLAAVLRERGVKPDMPVAVCLDRSPDLIVALLGILKAGGAYLPLDPTHPPARNARLIANANATLVVSSNQSRLTAGLNVPIVNIDTDTRPIDDNLATITTSDQLAAVLYTSGSTGTPKGVMVTHRGIVRLSFNSGFCDFAPDRVFAFVAPIAFDAATFEIWGALLHGSQVAIYPNAIPEPDDLGRFLKRYQVDTLWLTAGLFNAIVDRNVQSLSNVKQLLTGGEAMSLPHARRALTALPNTNIINGYGPTESTTFATTWQLPREIPSDWTIAPIGRPIGNTTVAVLDIQFKPVPIGSIGELFIGGQGVARGYLHAPELTAERFIPSPVPELVGPLYRTGDRVRWRNDGTLEFLGRTDSQVKIRGQRIEPGETEAVLAQHPLVVQAAVVVFGTGIDARLVAYVVANSDAPRDASLLRNYLHERLPAYMVPSAMVFLDNLPLTANGKLDRQALPDPADVMEATPQARVSPRTDAERDVLKVWEHVLSQPDLSITDNFFDLGGHSLKAVELIGAIRDRLGHALPLGALYDAPTVEQLAASIQNKLEAGSEHHLVPLHEAGTRPPLFMVAGVGGHVFAFHKFSRLLDADQPSFGVKAIGVDGTRPPPERVEDIATEYVDEMIRLRPQGPFVLAGYSLGAVIAFEVALQLRARGLPVPQLIAFDAAAPGYLNFSVWKRAQLHLGNLIVRGGGWKYIKQRLRNLRDKLNWAAGRGHRNAPTIAGLEMYSQDAITQVWVALHKAYKVYRPTREFDGAILVIRADVVEDWDKYVSADPQLGWGRWTTGPIETHGLHVRHLDLFHEPAIFETARLVDATLRRIAGNK